MLQVQRDAFALGVGVPLLILGGAGEPDPIEVHKANPLSEIAYRGMEDFGGGIYDYRPDGGWRHATRQMGYEFARRYWGKFIAGRGVEFVKAITYHVFHNEPIDELGDGAEIHEGLILWTHGILDFCDEMHVKACVGNWSAGLDALVGDLRRDVWKRADMIALFRRVMAGGHVVNFHQGAIKGEADLIELFDSLRHRAIREVYMSVAPDLAKMQIVSTEFYTTHVRGLTGAQWLAQLMQLIPKLREDQEFFRWLALWTYGTPSGDEKDMWFGDDWQFLIAIFWQVIRMIAALRVLLTR